MENKSKTNRPSPPQPIGSDVNDIYELDLESLADDIDRKVVSGKIKINGKIISLNSGGTTFLVDDKEFFSKEEVLDYLEL
jgi:hypothetical protein